MDLMQNFLYKTVHYFASQFLKLSKKGLENRSQLNSNNDDESIFLDDLENFIKLEKNLSNILIEEYHNKYKQNLNLIFDEKAF